MDAINQPLLDVRDLSHEGVGLAIERPRLKIGTHPAAQTLGLADLDDFAGAVLVEINAGRNWDFFEFFG